MTNIHEIEDFSMPSGWKPPRGFKSYKPRKRSRAVDNGIEIIYGFFAIVLIMLSCFLAWSLSNPEPAKAQVKTAKDCLTNQCVLDIVCAGHSGYVNEKEICSN